MPADWSGSLLIGTLVGECLIRLQMRDGAVVKEERYLHHSIGRIRDVAMGPGGYIFLLTDGTEASIYRVEPLPDEIANRRPLQ
jgi:glucose/arabinose dehydrogenase